MQTDFTDPAWTTDMVERGRKLAGQQHPDPAALEDYLAATTPAIRAKWAMDGAATLTDAASQLRQHADMVEQLAADGWELDGPVGNDYGHLRPAAGTALDGIRRQVADRLDQLESADI